jgi:hypothetical protein
LSSTAVQTYIFVFAAICINKGILDVIRTHCGNRNAQIINLVEIICQCNVKFFSSFVALLCDCECGLVFLKVIDVHIKVAFNSRDLLTVCKATIAVIYSFKCISISNVEVLIVTACFGIE